MATSPTPPTGSAVRATVLGRVQGVGYRHAVVERARALGVLGWVRNQDDGSVLVHAEGPASQVEALGAFLREGPDGAAVASVDASAAEVEGHEQFAVRGVSAGRFVVARGGAQGAGPYVFALEVDGVLRTWSLRKPPSMVPSEKRLAIAGAAADAAGLEPWDHGTYEQGGRVAWPEAVERGHAVFVLHGERLRGGFALQRTRGEGDAAQWLLVKRRDEFAAAPTAS